jgi:hypothetical protein
MVLLKLDLMCTTPIESIFFAFFLVVLFLGPAIFLLRISSGPKP